MSSERRSRKRARVLEQWAKDEREAMFSLAFYMVVCDKCGLVQEYHYSSFDEENPWHAPTCKGALGMTCDSTTCTPAECYLT